MGSSLPPVRPEGEGIGPTGGGRTGGHVDVGLLETQLVDGVVGNQARGIRPIGTREAPQDRDARRAQVGFNLGAECGGSAADQNLLDTNTLEGRQRPGLEA